MIAWLRKRVRPEMPPTGVPTDPAPAAVVREARPPERLPYEKVAARAADIWRRKGRPPGQDEQNWLEAEAELRAEPGSPDPRKPR